MVLLEARGEWISASKHLIASQTTYVYQRSGGEQGNNIRNGMHLAVLLRQNSNKFLERDPAPEVNRPDAQGCTLVLVATGCSVRGRTRITL